MNARVLKISKKPSRYGQDFYYIFCKTDDGISCKSCVSPQYGNYVKWSGLISKMERINDHEINATLLGIKLRGKLIDADVLGKIEYEYKAE